MNSDIQLYNKRIAKNTLLLYIRTFFTLLINLYTYRVVLNALGVEDLGIYNVVGGVVGMFTLISGSMTTTTQRFIAFELGIRDGNTNNEIRRFANVFCIGLLCIIFVCFTNKLNQYTNLF